MLIYVKRKQGFNFTPLSHYDCTVRIFVHRSLNVVEDQLNSIQNSNKKLFLSISRVLQPAESRIQPNFRPFSRKPALFYRHQPKAKKPNFFGWLIGWFSASWLVDFRFFSAKYPHGGARCGICSIFVLLQNWCCSVGSVWRFNKRSSMVCSRHGRSAKSQPKISRKPAKDQPKASQKPAEFSCPAKSQKPKLNFSRPLASAESSSQNFQLQYSVCRMYAYAVRHQSMLHQPSPSTILPCTELITENRGWP